MTGLWREREPLDRLLLLSVVALAFNTHGDPLPLVGFLALFGIGVVRPSLLRQWWTWATIVGVQGGHQLLRWEGVDDHIILGTYWALTICLGLAVGRPQQVMARSARWMIGLVFLFAAGWKIATADFRNGPFSRCICWPPPRFRGHIPELSKTAGGVRPGKWRLRESPAAAPAASPIDSAEVTIIPHSSPCPSRTPKALARSGKKIRR